MYDLVISVRREGEMHQRTQRVTEKHSKRQFFVGARDSCSYRKSLLVPANNKIFLIHHLQGEQRVKKKTRRAWKNDVSVIFKSFKCMSSASLIFVMVQSKLKGVVRHIHAHKRTYIWIRQANKCRLLWRVVQINDYQSWFYECF